MSRTFTRPALGGIALIVVVIVLGNMAVAYQNAVRVAGTAARVTHSQAVLSALASILASAKDAESGERGYIITGNTRYLAPYDSAERRIERGITDADTLTRDNPLQHARIPQVRAITDERLALLRMAISVLQERGLDAARANPRPPSRTPHRRSCSRHPRTTTLSARRRRH